MGWSTSTAMGSVGLGSSALWQAHPFSSGVISRKEWGWVGLVFLVVDAVQLPRLALSTVSNLWGWEFSTSRVLWSFMDKRFQLLMPFSLVKVIPLGGVFRSSFSKQDFLLLRATDFSPGGSTWSWTKVFAVTNLSFEAWIIESELSYVTDSMSWLITVM